MLVFDFIFISLLFPLFLLLFTFSFIYILKKTPLIMSEKQPSSSAPKHSFFSFSSLFGHGSSAVPAGQAMQDHSGTIAASPPAGSTNNTKMPASPSYRRYSLSHPITPDQALNLSRATASSSTGAPLSRVASADSNLHSPNKPVPVPSNRAKRKRRDSTAYQGIGLVAAYSGGPSSF